MYHVRSWGFDFDHDGRDGPVPGYAHTTLVDRSTGATHTDLGLCRLEPGAELGRHVHAFEQCAYVLEGRPCVEPGGARYLLRSGSVAVELEFCGEAMHVTDVGEGAQLGDLSFIDAQGAGATLIARSPCTAYKLTREALSRLYSYREDMAHELLVHTLKGMSGTIRAMNESQAAALRYIRGQHH